MNENIKIMLEKVMRDEELQKKVATATTPEEAYALAISIHGGYTMEEFIEASKTIQDQQNADLSDEELAKTAGGFWPFLVTATATLISYAVSMGAGT